MTDKILKINENHVIDLSHVESIERYPDTTLITIIMQSGRTVIYQGIKDYANIVNRWIKLIEGEDNVR